MYKIKQKKHIDHWHVLFFGRFKKYLGKINRKDLPRWIHFATNKQNKTTLEIETTACGKTARSKSYKTSVMDNVSCPRCLEKMKEDNWFCPEHGFITDVNVSFEETCVLCKRPV